MLDKQDKILNEIMEKPDRYLNQNALCMEEKAVKTDSTKPPQLGASSEGKLNMSQNKIQDEMQKITTKNGKQTHPHCLPPILQIHETVASTLVDSSVPMLKTPQQQGKVPEQRAHDTATVTTRNQKGQIGGTERTRLKSVTKNSEEMAVTTETKRPRLSSPMEKSEELTTITTADVSQKTANPDATKFSKCQLPEKDDVKETKTSKYKQTNEDDGWIVVKNRRKRVVDPKIRPNSIEGIKESSSLKVVTPNSHVWLFISRLTTDTTEEEIKNYIKLNADIDCECAKITTKWKSRYSSFKVGVQANVKNVVLNENFWPKGVLVNNFLNLRKIASPLGQKSKTTSHK